MPGMSTTMKLKGSKMRVDAGPMSYTIIDGVSGEVRSVVPSQQMVMKMSAAAMKQAVQAAMTNQSTVAPKLTATGRKETINGFACEEYTTEYAGMKAELWLAPDVPNYKEILRQMNAVGESMRKSVSTPMEALKPDDYPGYPVRSVMQTPAGKIMSTVESIKLDDLPDSDFEVPADYKVMEMPGAPAAK